MFTLSQRSKNNLKGVHVDLARVIVRAIQITPVDFMVIEGVRTAERQRELFNAVPKKTQTMNSRHLTGHAVDCAPLVNGAIPWNDKAKFKAVSDAVFLAAKELNIRIRWGGDWNENGRSDDEKFYDGPHFELRKQDYP